MASQGPSQGHHTWQASTPAGLHRHLCRPPPPGLPGTHTSAGQAPPGTLGKASHLNQQIFRVLEVKKEGLEYLIFSDFFSFSKLWENAQTAENYLNDLIWGMFSYFTYSTKDWKQHPWGNRWQNGMKLRLQDSMAHKKAREGVKRMTILI